MITMILSALLLQFTLYITISRPLFNYFAIFMLGDLYITGWNDKIVVLKKTTLQLYFKTFIEKINLGNLIML